MLYIIYFNLKNGVSDEEKLVKQSKELSKLLEGKVEGLGSVKLYQHYLIGANPRTYQMHVEFKDFGMWDRYVASFEKDTEVARLRREWINLMDMKTNYDETVREIPL